MKKNYIRHIWLRLMTVIVCFSDLASLSSCKKYLEAKPDQSIATPATIEDLEGIINNYAFLNARYPSAGEISADDYYLTTADWSSLIEIQRDFYTWQKNDQIGADYVTPYSSIEYANIVLDALPKIPASDRKNRVNGNALFIRAAHHFALAQLFCKPYNSASAATDLGIALRLTSDVAVKPKRSTVAETYASIISDLKTAEELLPAMPDFKYHASKDAVYALLARVYLSMRDYSSAGSYSGLALAINNQLIDYNTVSASAAVPFVQFNDEVIYDARTAAQPALSQARAKVDTLLYNSYEANDLRKTIFFKQNADGSQGFKGNYTGQRNAALFTGMANDELYLIKAETAARQGRIDTALSAINKLLVNRWAQGTFVPVTIRDQQQLLLLILQERRKELLFRGLRWTDLRRLNQGTDFKQTIQRNVNGMTYSLAPGSDRYVLEIDQNAVHISGLQQNP